jgi:hypothetical protein
MKCGWLIPKNQFPQPAVKAVVALHFWTYNFTWMYWMIRCTPAMAAGIALKPFAG